MWKDRIETLGATLYVVSHPIKLLEAKGRQIMVSIDHEEPPPPPAASIEDFPNLNAFNAAVQIRLAQMRSK